uniref:ras-associated and pleckstrin homology domains-containing protein 1-like isoform X2 n=1 Tax=Scatophagus argus TaxID=75038 RepID=UPI001ED7FB4D|nr:ras-associated and pleckstrin homology domains-containing protein 1-like isoform X2 [Scatophagus argus]
MAAVPPPPPPPPPCRSQPVRIRSAPCPAHAAVPYCDSLAIQETAPSLEALLEDAPATPPLPLLFPVPQGLEENPHDSVEKTGPVQETNPAAQAPISPQEHH